MPIKQVIDVEKIREDFPILKQTVNNKLLAYLDNSATSQKPQAVIDSITQYYKEYNSNVHRSIHKLSELATLKYEEAHKKIAEFIGASFEEIIFTRGTTEGLNLLAYSLSHQLKTGDEIVLTQMEHHSNIVPWQQIAKQKGLVLRFIPINDDMRLDIAAAKKIITSKTKIVSITHMSNVFGTINPVTELAEIAHKNSALFIVDGAQSIPHMPINVKSLNCDFFVCSGHKMFGPTGIGFLYGKKHLLEAMNPFLYGGDMIAEVSFENSTWNELPWKFEAGTPNIAGAIGLGIAVDYINNIGINNIMEYEKQLTAYAINKLKKIKGIHIYGPQDSNERGSVISFTIDGIHPHDIATLLDREGIAIRGGHHCAMPLMSLLGISGTARISLAFYNTFNEIDTLIVGIKKAQEVFGI